MLENLLYTNIQTRKIDEIAIEQQFDGDDYILMSRAGCVVFDIVKKHYPDKNIIIFCGEGNNGGDGIKVAVEAIKNKNYHKNKIINLILLYDKNKLFNQSLTSAANKASEELLELLDESNCNILELAEFEEILKKNTANYQNNYVAIDALLGTGLNKAPTGAYKQAIDHINQFKNIIAVDIPSGLDANTGYAYNPCVKAKMTITFIAYKQGMFTLDSKDYLGKLYFNNLDVDPKIYNQVEYNAWLITKNWANSTIKKYFGARKQNSHKHQFGHVLIIGGDIGMPGAVLMSGIAALRVGAGIVSVVTHSHHSSEINIQHPELMTYGYDINNRKSQDIVSDLINKANTIIIGPGLGRSDWSNDIFKTVFANINNNGLKNILIDADGLRILSKNKEILDKNKLVKPKINLILTPHPGEAKSLLEKINIKIDHDRFKTSKLLSEAYQAAIILKGSGTIIYDAVYNHENKYAVCNHGNAGMATAGMGDILSGIIAGLWAQTTVDGYTVCCLAVYLHALAGDYQAQKYGEKGLIATDILQEIREIINQQGV